jgi:hypothetical protein
MMSANDWLILHILQMDGGETREEVPIWPIDARSIDNKENSYATIPAQ